MFFCYRDEENATAHAKHERRPPPYPKPETNLFVFKAGNMAAGALVQAQGVAFDDR